MALNPNVVVVNPGELITSAHLNNIRSNLLAHDSAILRPAETSSSTLVLASTGITTALTSVPNAVTLGTRGFDRVILVSAAISLTGGTSLDMYLRCSNVVVGLTRRVRFATGTSGHISNVFYVAANQASATVDVAIAAATGSATVATSGGADMNYIIVQMIPIASVTVVP